MAKGRKAVSFSEVCETFRTACNLLGLEAHIVPVMGDDTSCAIIQGDACTMHKNSNVREHLHFMLEMSKSQTHLHPSAILPKE